MLARQTKKDLRIISSDGEEVFGHTIVVGLFSKSMADLFLSHDKDDAMTCVMVPVQYKDLEDLFKILYDTTENITEIDLHTAGEASAVLDIDLSDAVSFNQDDERVTNYIFEMEDSLKESKDSVMENKEPIAEEYFESKELCAQIDAKPKLEIEVLNDTSEASNSKAKGKGKVKYYGSKRRLTDPSLIYSCDKCAARFKLRDSLKRHQFTDHQIKIQCESCSDVSIDFKSYQEHRKTHLTFVCKECGEICSSNSQLNSHENQKHGKGDKDKACPYCAKHVFNLKAHIQASHEGEMMICSKCEYSTRRKHSLEKHFENVHSETVMKTCQFCGGSYKRVDRHIEITNCGGGQKERKKLSCEQCDKTFTLQETLKKHIKIVHLQIRNKTCLYCDYKTHTKFNLDLHINKMHLGIQTEKQTCSHCDVSTYRLEHHMKIYHGELI